MNSIRRRLRLWAAAWLLCQGASVSAFVTLDCCTVHRPAERREGPACHQNRAATHCPMRAAGGAPCPMHRAGSHDAAPSGGNRCAMRGTCNGPVAAMAALLAQCGILPAAAGLSSPHLHAAAAIPYLAVQPIARLSSPDPPPPRA